MKNKKPKFECTVDGSIIVTSALRYALGRHTYVPGSVQDWIKCYWDDLDSKTKCVIVRDTFEHLYEEHRDKSSGSSWRISVLNNYDLETWRNFGIDRYCALNESEQNYIYQSMMGSYEKIDWYDKELSPKIYERKEVINMLAATRSATNDDLDLPELIKDNKPKSKFKSNKLPKKK